MIKSGEMSFYAAAPFGLCYLCAVCKQYLRRLGDPNIMETNAALQQHKQGDGLCWNINTPVEKHELPLTQRTPLNDLQQRCACSPFSSCVAFFPPSSETAEVQGREAGDALCCAALNLTLGRTNSILYNLEVYLPGLKGDKR